MVARGPRGRAPVRGDRRPQRPHPEDAGWHDGVLVVPATENLGPVRPRGRRSALPRALAREERQRDALGTVARLGGDAVLAHPFHPGRPFTRWTRDDWAGMEVVSNDTFWGLVQRDQAWWRAAKSLLVLPWDPGRSMLAFFQEPARELARFDAASARRKVALLCASDAHGWPTYGAAFEAFSMHVPVTPTGERAGRRRRRPAGAPRRQRPSACSTPVAPASGVRLSVAPGGDRIELRATALPRRPGSPGTSSATAPRWERCRPRPRDGPGTAGGRARAGPGGSRGGSTARPGSSPTPCGSSRNRTDACTPSTRSRATSPSPRCCRCCSSIPSSGTGSRSGSASTGPGRPGDGHAAHLAPRGERRRPALAPADDAGAEGAHPGMLPRGDDHHQQRPRDGARQDPRGRRGGLRALRPPGRHPPGRGRAAPRPARARVHGDLAQPDPRRPQGRACASRSPTAASRRRSSPATGPSSAWRASRCAPSRSSSCGPTRRPSGRCSSARRRTASGSPATPSSTRWCSTGPAATTRRCARRWGSTRRGRSSSPAPPTTARRSCSSTCTGSSSSTSRACRWWWRRATWSGPGGSWPSPRAPGSRPACAARGPRRDRPRWWSSTPSGSWPPPTGSPPWPSSAGASSGAAARTSSSPPGRGSRCSSAPTWRASRTACRCWWGAAGSRWPRPSSSTRWRASCSPAPTRSCGSGSWRARRWARSGAPAPATSTTCCAPSPAAAGMP